MTFEIQSLAGETQEWGGVKPFNDIPHIPLVTIMTLNGKKRKFNSPFNNICDILFVPSRQHNLNVNKALTPRDNDVLTLKQRYVNVGCVLFNFLIVYSNIYYGVKVDNFDKCVNLTISQILFYRYKQWGRRRTVLNKRFDCYVVFIIM